MPFHSKVHSDGVICANGTMPKTIRITSRTAYQLTMRQGQQEGDTSQVRTGQCPMILTR